MKPALISFLIVLLLGLTGCNSAAHDMQPMTIQADQLITINDDFKDRRPNWQEQTGHWIFKSGVLIQTSTNNRFPLILFTEKKFSDLDITVDFKTISGRIDASGGLVFRAKDQYNYYIVRANSLENNFRLYTFKNGRRSQIASAKASPPALGIFHNLRVIAKQNHIQAYLNGTLLIDHYDSSFETGHVGLWTKADAVTEFDNLNITGY